jgi:hypothetical protein
MKDKSFSSDLKNSSGERISFDSGGLGELGKLIDWATFIFL